MLQAGPVINVHMPKDKVTGLHQGYGFVEFRGEEDAEYAIKVMNSKYNVDITKLKFINCYYSDQGVRKTDKS